MLDFKLYTLRKLRFAKSRKLESLIQTIKSETPQQYREYLNYLNSANSVEHLLLYLSGHSNPFTNRFYITWLLQSYTFNGGMSNGQPISKVLQALLKNITKINGCEKQMIEILFATSDNQALFENILSVFMAALREPRQLEQLCVKYVEITESLTDRQLNRFEQLLLETPGAAPIATRLCTRKIASSKNPEDEFWRFYDNQRSRISANSGFTIEPMILACINNVDAKIREDVAIDILCKINASIINDGETIMVLTNAVNDCSVKELLKMDNAFLQRVCQIRAKVDKSGLEKIKAVFIGEMLTTNNAQRKRPVNLSSELAQTGISLKSVDKSDYEAYIKNYFDEYFVFGSLITAFTTFAHIAVLFAFFAFIYMGFGLLWLIDRIYIMINKIKNACPNPDCQASFLIPTYECPGCGEKHTNLVPSKYGILKRTCLCGTKLPTTFLNGRGQLKAYCPECDTALSGDTASRQYAFPVIGGPSVGKTCFINMAIDQMMSDVAPEG